MSTPLPQSKKRLLLIAFVFALLGFVVSLPWQKRQWDETARLKQQTAAQEKQVNDLANPASSVSPLDAATTLLQQDKVDEATRLLNQLETRLRADAPSEAALRLSELFQQAGRIDRAYHWAAIAHRKAPDGLEEMLRLGTLALLIGHLEPAQQVFQKALKQYPNRAEPLIAFALYLNQTEDGTRAAENLRRALVLQPENWRARLLLVQQLVRQDSFEVARQELQPLRSEPTAQAAFWLETASLYHRQAQVQPNDRPTNLRRAEEALEAVAKLPDAPDPAELMFRRGQIHLLRGDKARARAGWEQTLALNPEYPGLKFALGRLLIQTGDRARGASLLKEQERSKAIDEEYDRLVLAAGTAPETADGHRALARWCQARGRTARARLEWEFVRRLAPNDWEANRAITMLSP